MPRQGPSLRETDRCGGERIGRYEVVRELDRGTTGVVYLARDLLARRRAVALKVCDEGRLASRFAAEAEVRRRLEHPGIVRMLDAGVASGRFYLAMEVIGGGSLAHSIARRPLAPRRVVELGIVLARALGHVHAQGLVHRDVKPSNVLLDWRGEPHLTDFGLALDYRRQTGQGDIAGTPAFMAPEQLFARRLRPSADLYGLGATLYECLTRRTPFECRTLHELRARVEQERPAPPSRLVPGVPRRLEVAVMRCLATHPEDRWPDAKALELALQTALDREADTPPTGVARPRPAPAQERELLTIPIEVAAFEPEDKPPTLEIATRRVARRAGGDDRS